MSLKVKEFFLAVKLDINLWGESDFFSVWVHFFKLKISTLSPKKYTLINVI